MKPQQILFKSYTLAEDFLEENVGSRCSAALAYFRRADIYSTRLFQIVVFLLYTILVSIIMVFSLYTILVSIIMVFSLLLLFTTLLAISMILWGRNKIERGIFSFLVKNIPLARNEAELIRKLEEKLFKEHNWSTRNIHLEDIIIQNNNREDKS